MGKWRPLIRKSNRGKLAFDEWCKRGPEGDIKSEWGAKSKMYEHTEKYWSNKYWWQKCNIIPCTYSFLHSSASFCIILNCLDLPTLFLKINMIFCCWKDYPSHLILINTCVHYQGKAVCPSSAIEHIHWNYIKYESFWQISWFLLSNVIDTSV